MVKSQKFFCCYCNIMCSTSHEVFCILYQIENYFVCAQYNYFSSTYFCFYILCWTKFKMLLDIGLMHYHRLPSYDAGSLIIVQLFVCLLSKYLSYSYLNTLRKCNAILKSIAWKNDKSHWVFFSVRLFYYTVSLLPSKNDMQNVH